jgi:hypothetical protein
VGSNPTLWASPFPIEFQQTCRRRSLPSAPMRGHKRFKDGAWRLVVDAGKDPITGKRRQVNRTVRAPTPGRVPGRPTSSWRASSSTSRPARRHRALGSRSASCWCDGSSTAGVPGKPRPRTQRHHCPEQAPRPSARRTGTADAAVHGLSSRRGSGGQTRPGGFVNNDGTPDPPRTSDRTVAGIHRVAAGPEGLKRVP